MHDSLPMLRLLARVTSTLLELQDMHATGSLTAETYRTKMTQVLAHVDMVHAWACAVVTDLAEPDK